MKICVSVMVGMMLLVVSFLVPLYWSGGYGGEATPVPIPNTVVKLSCAEDTWWVTAWENRSPPD